MPSRRRAGTPCDLEEVRPGRFVLHNPAVAQVLRGEGDRTGDRFVLQSQRVDGLLARLRQRGFRVLTLADQIAVLPRPPARTAADVAQPLVLQTADRVSLVDISRPSGWRELAAAADGRYLLPAGAVVRLRSGRGPARYVRLESGGRRPLTLDQALLCGYAEAAPAADMLQRDGDGWRLPPLVLPAPYRALIERWAEPTADGGWCGAQESVALTQQLIGRLTAATKPD